MEERQGPSGSSEDSGKEEGPSQWFLVSPSGFTIQIPCSITIGRKHLHLETERVSDEHLRLHPKDDALHVESMGKNSSFIQHLNSDDVIPMTKGTVYAMEAGAVVWLLRHKIRFRAYKASVEDVLCIDRADTPPPSPPPPSSSEEKEKVGGERQCDRDNVIEEDNAMEEHRSSTPRDRSVTSEKATSSPSSCWACAICTVQNTMENVFCQVCGSPRPNYTPEGAEVSSESSNATTATATATATVAMNHPKQLAVRMGRPEESSPIAERGGGGRGSSPSGENNGSIVDRKHTMQEASVVFCAACASGRPDAVDAKGGGWGGGKDAKLMAEKREKAIAILKDGGWSCLTLYNTPKWAGAKPQFNGSKSHVCSTIVLI
eukprot:jgi/Bigna1/78606/fgenesh1_pg.56_\